MEKRYDLKEFPLIDSMHDQRINVIGLDKDKLIFSYDDLHYYETNYEANSKYYIEHKDFSSCKIIFIGGHEAYAEVRVEEKLNVTATIYYMDEFIEFIKKNEYIIETIGFFCGYETIVIKSTLVNKVGYYCEDCIFTIPVSLLIYQWS